MHEVSVDEARTALAADPSARLLDVREDREWMAAHAEGATHVARGVVERDIEKLVPDPHTPLYLYCGGGYRSALAADALQAMGYDNVHSIAGGWRAWQESGAPVAQPAPRPRVTGIGGIFLKSPDHKRLTAWYVEHLGIGAESWGAVFPFREHAAPQVEGYTVWSVSPETTTYFGDSGQRCMVNYRVRDLDALLERLKDEGVWIDEKRDDGEFGRFAWIKDPDGNRIELWEPPGERLP